MRDTKVYLVMENLSNRERGKFLKYIQSPYFNKNQPLVELAKLINKNLQGTSQKTLTKNQVWKKLQPAQSYDDVRLRKYLSDLLKHLENFLSLQVFEKNDFHKNNFLLEAIVDRRMEKLYSTIKKHTNQLGETSAIKNANYYLFQYQAGNLIHELESFNEQRKEISTNFTYLSENLDIFYFSEKLKLNSYAEEFKRVDAKLNAEINYLDDILDYIKNLSDRSAPALSIYYHIHLLTRFAENEENYYQFKKELNEKIQFFPHQEAIPIYRAGINYCIRKLNTGQPEFLEELFSLYQGYVKSLVEDSGELTYYTFNNVITVALRLGKFTWVKNFIQEYGPFINEKHRDNAVTYNTASYHFYQKNHEEVIKLLRNIEYEDISYNLNSKTILLMTYYETDEFEPLHFLLESFRAYLNRNKTIPDSKKILYKNLIRLTKKLVNLPPNANKQLEKLKTEVTENKQVGSRKWLLEKIAELQ